MAAPFPPNPHSSVVALNGYLDPDTSSITASLKRRRRYCCCSLASPLLRFFCTAFTSF